MSAPAVQAAPSRREIVVVGAGLGGLTAAAILARSGRQVLLIERSNSVGGAASSYKVGDLFVEGSLQAIPDPRVPTDIKHAALQRAGVLDAVTLVPTGVLYEVRGGPIDRPLQIPPGPQAAERALVSRFPHCARAIGAFLAALDEAAQGNMPDTDRAITVQEKLDALFGAEEAVKCALAANLLWHHDDPARLAWSEFARMQGGLLAGSVFIDGGSQRLSSALARAIRAAGSEVLLRRIVIAMKRLPNGDFEIVHTAKDGSDPQRLHAGRIISGTAPEVTAEWLPGPDAQRLQSVFAGQEPSLALFTLTLGLKQPPVRFGVSSYATQLLPPWLVRLPDFAQASRILGAPPAGRMPPLSIADYSAIASGVPAPPHVLSVIGPDHIDNWNLPDVDAYRSHRKQWQDALIAALDRIYPGLAGAVSAASFTTAFSVRQYLGAPAGAVYGFAPTPQSVAGRSARLKQTEVPGLSFASAWSGGGGFGGAIDGGMRAADLVLCELGAGSHEMSDRRPLR